MLFFERRSNKLISSKNCDDTTTAVRSRLWKLTLLWWWPQMTWPGKNCEHFYFTAMKHLKLIIMPRACALDEITFLAAAGCV